MSPPHCDLLPLFFAPCPVPVIATMRAEKLAKRFSKVFNLGKSSTNYLYSEISFEYWRDRYLKTIA